MSRSKTPPPITAEEFDAKVDAGEDISEYLDIENASRRVNVDFPLKMLKDIDAEATRLGVPRQALIKLWLDEKIQLIKLRDKAS